MTTWFVTRHPGALDWAKKSGLQIDIVVAHLDPKEIQEGDAVIGILPVHLAAQVCERKARYFCLTVDIPIEARGKELTAEDMRRYNARLECYLVQAQPNCLSPKTGLK